MTNEQKLRQLSVKQLAKLLIRYHEDIDYYCCYMCDDDSDYGDESYYTFMQLDGNESNIQCMDEETAIIECMNYLNAQYKED